MPTTIGVAIIGDKTKSKAHRLDVLFIQPIKEIR